jgi:hypothetical protein
MILAEVAVEWWNTAGIWFGGVVVVLGGLVGLYSGLANKLNKQDKEMALKHAENQRFQDTLKGNMRNQRLLMREKFGSITRAIKRIMRGERPLDNKVGAMLRDHETELARLRASHPGSEEAIERAFRRVLESKDREKTRLPDENCNDA